MEIKKYIFIFKLYPNIYNYRSYYFVFVNMLHVIDLEFILIKTF